MQLTLCTCTLSSIRIVLPVGTPAVGTDDLLCRLLSSSSSSSPSSPSSSCGEGGERGSACAYDEDEDEDEGGRERRRKSRSSRQRLPVLVLTADASIRAIAKHYGASHVYPPSSHHHHLHLQGGSFGTISYQRLMLTRSRVVQALLRAHLSPLIADIDAVWTKNTLLYLPLQGQVGRGRDRYSDGDVETGTGRRGKRSSGPSPSSPPPPPPPAYDIAVTDDGNNEWCGCFVSIANTVKGAAFWDHVTALHVKLVQGAEVAEGGAGAGAGGGGGGGGTMPSFLESEQKIISRLLPRALLLPLPSSSSAAASSVGNDGSSGGGGPMYTHTHTHTQFGSFYYLPHTVNDTYSVLSEEDDRRDNSSASTYDYDGLVVVVLSPQHFPSGYSYFNYNPTLPPPSLSCTTTTTTATATTGSGEKRTDTCTGAGAGAGGESLPQPARNPPQGHRHHRGRLRAPLCPGNSRHFPRLRRRGRDRDRGAAESSTVRVAGTPGGARGHVGCARRVLRAVPQPNHHPALAVAVTVTVTGT